MEINPFAAIVIVGIAGIVLELVGRRSRGWAVAGGLAYAVLFVGAIYLLLGSVAAGVFGLLYLANNAAAVADWLVRDRERIFWLRWAARSVIYGAWMTAAFRLTTGEWMAWSLAAVGGGLVALLSLALTAVRTWQGRNARHFGVPQDVAKPVD